MLITYIGPDDALDAPFRNTTTDGFDVDFVSLSPTELVIRNPSNGIVTTFTGTGLPTDPALLESGLIPGTITGWRSASSSNDTIVTLSGISWPADSTARAIDRLISFDDPSLLVSLVGAQPVTLDASGAINGVRDLNFDGVLSPTTIIMSAGSDEVEGGSNNDTITVSANNSGIDAIFGSPGNDLITFAPGSDFNSFVGLLYTHVSGPITVNINGTGNPGTITKSGEGTDTLSGLQNVMDEDGQGFGIGGTNANDAFNINGGAGTWIRISGGAGTDSYNLTLSGSIRIGLGDTLDAAPSAGIVANLSTGEILNDGFGNVETLNITNGAGRLELETADFADNVIGSARNEVFILGGGDDTLDGGAGIDRLRFDRAAMTSGVVVDLAANSATGAWRGVAFSKTISNVEEIRGTGFADTIEGSAADELFSGRNGDDLLDGRAGNDTLRGDGGNDTMIGGGGFDIALFLGISSTDASFFFAIDDNLQVTSAAGFDNVRSDVELLRFDDADLSYAEAIAQIEGVTVYRGTEVGNNMVAGEEGAVYLGLLGNDWITPGAGNDTVDGGEGVDMVSFFDAPDRVVVDLLAGTAVIGAETDRLYNIENVTGSIYADLITGDAGANRIRALGDYDWMVGSGGGDTFEGGTGRDTVAYSNATSGVWASLLSDTGSVGQANGDRYVDVENLTGSSHGDRLTGDNDRNMLRGLGGDDFLFGNGGNDTLIGGSGRDYIDGGAQNDRMMGERGNDTIDGGYGWDTAIYSGRQADYTVTRNADGSTTVLHNGGGIDGIDLVLNVEVLQFSDGRMFL